MDRSETFSDYSSEHKFLMQFFFAFKIFVFFVVFFSVLFFVWKWPKKTEKKFLKKNKNSKRKKKIGFWDIGPRSNRWNFQSDTKEIAAWALVDR